MSPTLGGALTRPFGPSFQLQGATKTPLRGSKGRLLRLRTMRAREDDRCPPLGRSAGLAPPRRPGLPVVYRKTGRGRDGPWLTRTRTRARARRLRVLACNTYNAGAGPRHEASPPRIRIAHAVRMFVFCGGARVPAARRVERASQRRLSDVSAPDAAEYARANEVLCGALWPQPAAQQALQRVSVSLLHMLAADLGAAFGAAASVLPVGGAWTIAASALGFRDARYCVPD